jgi:ectoine hydroxylase-related dioxygenase (phytanoyl-CoA dioxygenase family)
MNAKSAPRSATLSEEQIRHYTRHGYVVVPGLVPAATCAAVIQASQPRLPAAARDWQPIVLDRARALNADADPGDGEIHRLLTEPNVLGAVEQLLDGPARVYYGMVAVVRAGGGRGLPWHQDQQYEHVLHHALNTFIAVSDIPPERCGLWVAPDSHLHGEVAARSSDDYGAGHRQAVSDPPGGMPLPAMRAGDACIFHRNTLHRSLTNRTEVDRYAYAAQYCAAGARLAKTGELVPGAPLARELAQRWAR